MIDSINLKDVSYISSKVLNFIVKYLVTELAPPHVRG